MRHERLRALRAAWWRRRHGYLSERVLNAVLREHRDQLSREQRRMAAEVPLAGSRELRILERALLGLERWRGQRAWGLAVAAGERAWRALDGLVLRAETQVRLTETARGFEEAERCLEPGQLCSLPAFWAVAHALERARGWLEGGWPQRAAACAAFAAELLARWRAAPRGGTKGLERRLKRSEAAGEALEAEQARQWMEQSYPRLAEQVLDEQGMRRARDEGSVLKSRSVLEALRRDAEDISEELELWLGNPRRQEDDG